MTKPRTYLKDEEELTQQDFQKHIHMVSWSLLQRADEQHTQALNDEELNGLTQVRVRKIGRPGLRQLIFTGR